jgi:tetratricopeptide (TPR) repeat protein
VLCCVDIATAEEAKSAALRARGNAAFKAGQLQEALDLYWEAVIFNPQDHALLNNISLAALRLGDLKQVCVSATCMQADICHVCIRSVLGIPAYALPCVCFQQWNCCVPFAETA